MTDANRTVTLIGDNALMTEISEITGAKELFTALGYLSQWNLTYPTVRIIWNLYDKVPEIVASYWRQDGTFAYQIGAIWNGESFGYHS